MVPVATLLGTLYYQASTSTHARIQKIFSGGVQSPRRGLTKNFNMAKINNLAIPGRSGGGGGGPDPLSSPSGSAHGTDTRMSCWKPKLVQGKVNFYNANLNLASNYNLFIKYHGIGYNILLWPPLDLSFRYISEFSKQFKL